MKARNTIVAAAAALAFAGIASAQDLPKNQFKVIGLNGPTVASMVDEVPFWRETITKASNGAITADITPLDQMGVDDKTMLRLLRLGVMDFAGMDISKMAGDDPRFEGCDLAGLTLDADKARCWRSAATRRRSSGAATSSAASTTSRARRCACSTTRCATSSAASAPPRSAWPSPRSSPPSTTASSIAA
jgi:hypothetical protein